MNCNTNGVLRLFISRFGYFRQFFSFTLRPIIDFEKQIDRKRISAVAVFRVTLNNSKIDRIFGDSITICIANNQRDILRFGQVSRKHSKFVVFFYQLAQMRSIYNSFLWYKIYFLCERPKKKCGQFSNKHSSHYHII